MARKEGLPDEVRKAIVQALACWDTPTEVAQMVREEYGREITKQSVQGYDPTKAAGQSLSKQWRTLFFATRKAFTEQEAEVGIAHRAFRLNLLQRMALRARTAGNSVLAAALLEQAAKEVGGAYTNRRELSGPNGKPIQTEDRTPAPTRESVRAGLLEAFGAAAASATAAGGDQVVRKAPGRRGAAGARRPARGKAVAGAK